MVFIEPYIQPRILRAILANGGKATTREIRTATGLKLMSIFHGATWLRRYGLLKKETIHLMDTDGRPRRLNTYTLDERQLRNIHMKINKIPEGWTR